MTPSWVESADDPASPFPIDNLPCGVVACAEAPPRCVVAVGEAILDLAALERAGLLAPAERPVFDAPDWNGFMALGPPAWAGLRARLRALLAKDGDPALREDAALCERAFLAAGDVVHHLPFTVAEFTDFYAGRRHAENVSRILRGPEAGLPESWLHLPMGYNGRASSVVVSGTEVARPMGQLKEPGVEAPHFGPSRRFDFELEIGAVVGQPSRGMVGVAAADAMIFGYVLLDDWSARDIQAWEYRPLGPFQAKATATTISPWIVPAAALAPFRVPGPAREVALLEYLTEPGPMAQDIALEVALHPAGAARPTVIARTNAAELYYSAAQQLAHHTTSGCPMRVGDLLGSGTISGPERGSCGSMLELSRGGAEPLTLETGERRGFLEDGDEVTITGMAGGAGTRIGFGACSGRVTPATGRMAG